MPERNRRKTKMTLLPEPDEIIPLLVRVGVGFLVAWLATGKAEQTAVTAAVKLEATETVVVAESLLEDEYTTIHEMIRYHAVREAECDGALEVYGRHFGDRHEFDHVMAECHSQTPAHPHAKDDPSLPAEDPNQ